MKKPAPQTIATAIHDAITRLIHSTDRFHEWESPEVVTLRDEIAKLQKVDARRAFNEFGALAAICARLDDLVEFYRKARLHPDKLDTDESFWYAFSNVGRYVEAYKIGAELLQPRHGYFPKIWQRAATRGHLRAVVELWSVAKRTYRDLNDDDVASFQRAAAFMVKARFSDDDVVNILDIMGEVQREHGIMFAGPYPLHFQLNEADAEGSAYLFGKMEIDAEVSEVQAMNRKLAKLVAERLGAFPDGLVLAFRKRRSEQQLLPVAA